MIILTIEKLEKTGKVTYKPTSCSKSEITDQEFKNIENSCKFFRRLGGIESIQRGYTCNGYVMTKLTSTSPDKENKTIRTFVHSM